MATEINMEVLFIMKKKIFAVAMATTMVLSSAMTAAAEDVDCSGWWVAHSKSYEIDADGLTLNFNAKSYADAANNWNSPIYVVYTAEAPFEGGAAVSTAAGYVEKFVMRADNYGWIGDNNTGATLQGLLDAGFTVGEASGVPADDAGWAAWLEGCKAGTTGTLKATKGDGNVNVVFTVNGLTSNITIPVDTSKAVYVSLTGELCAISNITEVQADAEEPSSSPDTDAPEVDGPEAPSQSPSTPDAEVEDVEVISPDSDEAKDVVEALGKLDEVAEDAEITVGNIAAEEGETVEVSAEELGFEDAAKVKVYRQAADGSMVLVGEFDVVDGKIQFESAGAGTYAFVAVDAEDESKDETPSKDEEPSKGEDDSTKATEGTGTDGQPQTGDTAPVAILVAIAALAGAGVVVSRKKRA